MAVVCALQPIPNQGAPTREDLFSIALVCKVGRHAGLTRVNIAPASINMRRCIFGNAEQVPRGAVIPVLGGLQCCKSSP